MSDLTMKFQGHNQSGDEIKWIQRQKWLHTICDKLKCQMFQKFVLLHIKVVNLNKVKQTCIKIFS